MKPGEKGFALVAVLVILAIATGIAAAALVLARNGIQSGRGYAAEVEGGTAAQAAIRLAAIRLADAESYGLRDVALERYDWNGWTLTVRVEDEAGKIDLNRAPRDRIVSALVEMGVERGRAQSAVPPDPRRFIAVDDLAARAGMPAEAAVTLRRRFTVYGAELPQPPGIRSSLETYQITAQAQKGKSRILRWATVRLSPGFGSPFEWLERGEGGSVIE